MSAATARAPRVSPARPATSWRPRLEVVPSPAPARSVVPYLLLCALVLAGALIGALVLNTHMASTAYVIHDQQVELNRLDEAAASLLAQVEEAGSPAALHRAADRLGMVPAEGMRFVELGSGRVLGAEED